MILKILSIKISIRSFWLLKIKTKWLPDHEKKLAEMPG